MLSESIHRPPTIYQKEDALHAQEAARQDAKLEAAGVAEIEEERATQLAAVADGVDPKKEVARIRERHISHAVSGNVGKGMWIISTFSWVVVPTTPLLVRRYLDGSRNRVCSRDTHIQSMCSIWFNTYINNRCAWCASNT